MTRLMPQKTIMMDGRKIKIHNNIVYLNPFLIRKQKLTWLKVAAILRVHKTKHDLLDWMSKTTKKKELRRCAKLVTQIEYELQALWGFKKDKKYHKFWNLPGCQCPKMDNDDIWPSGYYITSGSCPIHGKR